MNQRILVMTIVAYKLLPILVLAPLAGWIIVGAVAANQNLHAYGQQELEDNYLRLAQAGELAKLQPHHVDADGYEAARDLLTQLRTQHGPLQAWSVDRGAIETGLWEDANRASQTLTLEFAQGREDLRFKSKLLDGQWKVESVERVN